MAEAVSIAYDLGQHGWSSFKLTIGEASAELGPFGYCTDALGDLIRAALLMATSAGRAEVLFDGEPAEWQLTLNKLGTSCHVDVTFPNIPAPSSESGGDQIFEGTCRVDDFARAVFAAAQTIWNEYGAEGYNEAWLPIANGFPLRGLQALEAALATDEPSLVQKS